MSTWLRYVSFSVAGAAIILVALFAMQGTAPRAQAVFNDSDGDGVIDLAETISGSNPNSVQSTPEDSGSDSLLATALCHDGIDNDGDGLVDSADTGCQDSDNDIVSNAMETLLGSDSNDGASFPEDARFDAVLDWIGFGSIVTCADATDNDRDGNVDAADSGCTPIRGDSDTFDDRVEKLFGSNPADGNSVPEHELANPGSCSDGIDNDLDGATDMADTGCSPAPNDAIADATNVGSLPFDSVEKITTAGIESGEPRPSCFFDTPSATVWYTYTPSADGVAVVDTSGSSFTNVVAVWTRSATRFSQAACVSGYINGPGSASSSRAAFHVTHGVTYLIQVGGFIFPDQPGNLHFRVLAGNPPSNDNYGSAHVITSLPFDDTVNAADATSEFGEPAPLCSYSPSLTTVWYRYNATSDGVLVVDASTSQFQTAVDAWTDSPFGLTSVACAAVPSRLAVKVEAGRTYYLQVSAAYGTIPGTLRFSAESAIAPPNDDFSNAMLVSSKPFEQTVDTFTASAEFGEPSPTCAYGPMIQTVWYKVMPSQSGYLKATVDNIAQPGATLVSVYQGASLNNLTQVACSSLYGPSGSTTAFQALAGQTYYIQIGQPEYRGGKLPNVAGGVEPPIPAPLPIPGVITFHLETLTVPSCAASEFKVNDPTGDTIGVFGPPPPPGAPDAPLDITSVSGGSDGENFCMRVEFSGTIPAPNPNGNTPIARIEFDTDNNTSTGYGGSLEYQCPGGPELGVEVATYFQIPSQLLVPLEISFVQPVPIPIAGLGPIDQAEAFAIFGPSWFQIIIPLSTLGGDDVMHFGLATQSNGGSDCVPNGGGITSPTPAPMGDVNCDGVANSVDVSLILQQFAGILFGGLPCQYVGDVNHNGSVGPVDATIILQYTSGMLPAFPAG